MRAGPREERITRFPREGDLKSWMEPRVDPAMLRTRHNAMPAQTVRGIRWLMESTDPVTPPAECNVGGGHRVELDKPKTGA
jgi:hypothetical protein